MVEKLGIYIIGGAGFVGTSLIKIFNKEDTNYYCCDLTKSPIAKKNMIKVGIKNSAIKKLTPTKNQIKYILINYPFY